MDMNATMIKISVADYMNFVDEAWKAASLEAERDTLKARIAELEAERDTLKDKIDDLEFEVITLTTDVRSVEADAAFHQERWEEVEDQLVRAEAERDEWFSKYQVLKERTDNYDFLLHKTREQETAIYRLVKEINKLGG